jgi:predicted RNA-binding Zn ribbon-like protein
MRQPGDRVPAPDPLAAVQDLANTYDIEVGSDRLRTVEELAAFCAAHDLVGLTFDGSDLAAVREFRETLRDACQAHAGTDVPAGSLAALNASLAGAPLVVSVDAAGAARAVPASGLGGASAVLAHLAAAILAGSANGTWARLKACEADSCRWVYYDHSPGGRSRWCTMSICGSRAKMRAYRAGKARTTRSTG